MAVGIPQTGFYYEHQLKSYILQFMAIFTGLQVQVGRKSTGVVTTSPPDPCDGTVTPIEQELDARLVSVPVYYGAMDRVVASLFADNTQNKPLRLPCMSAYMTNLSLTPELLKGVGFNRSQTYLPTGGLLPDDVRVIHQRMPVPYMMEIELYLYASNTDQHFQMLEQILIMFDPYLLQIQTNDSLFDWTKITQVELKNINIDQNFPPGADRRIIQSKLSFQVPIYISAPAEIRKDFVEKIFARIGVVNVSDMTNFEILEALDEQGIEYEQIGGLPPDFPVT